MTFNSVEKFFRFMKQLRSRYVWQTTSQARADMENITQMWLEPMPKNSEFLKPARFYYIQNGTQKHWDVLKVHDSVAILIFNTTRQKLVFVQQFRPAVFHGIVTSRGYDFDNIDLEKFPPYLGVTTELCAGIVDKNMCFKHIAREEVLEECGYNVGVERLQEIITSRSGVGASAPRQVMFYCEVNDADKRSNGGGIGHEIIDVVEYSIEEVRKMVSKGSIMNSPPGCLMGILWFLMNKDPLK